MRIKHQPTETFRLSTNYKNKGWFPYKHYSTKQAAVKAMKRIKKEYEKSGFKFKIEWLPYPFCKKEDEKIVYTEE